MTGLRIWLRPSRIWLRLLAFNVLVVFVPVLGVLSLGVYESHLRQAQENAMANEARILAAAIGAAATGDTVDTARVTSTFDALERRTEVRLRVYDAGGALLADSARGSAVAIDSARHGADPSDTRARLLYRLGAHIATVARAAIARVRRPSTSGSSSDADPDGRVELRAALAGRYGAAVRVTPGQRSLTMFSAIPVRRGDAVVGAVVASQSTYRILRALYDVRLRVFEVVLASLFVAGVLTTVAATTIVGPLERLRMQAARLAERRASSTISFPGTERRDELGDLARALEELTRRTNAHIELLQTFSADVSHELKNPLASIRTAAEMMADAESADERARFLTLMTRDVARLERLVTSLREVAIVERQIAEETAQPLELAAVLREVVDAASRLAGARVPIVLNASGPVMVRGSRERLAQVFDNLVANAVSFAADGTTVGITVAAQSGTCVVAVDDRGPGIPDSHLERIFTRFFSYRPAERRGGHVGLGLAIARQIVDSYGGSITAGNRSGGGAHFEVRLPLLDVGGREPIDRSHAVQS